MRNDKNQFPLTIGCILASEPIGNVVFSTSSNGILRASPSESRSNGERHMTQMIIKQITVGPMANFAYLIGDENAHECAIVDPGWDCAEILRVAESLSLAVTKILLTHSHFDHARAVEELAKATKATVYVHKKEASEIPKGLTVEATQDGTVVKIGSIEVRCLHTPGHTPGSQCFVAGGAIFTGDTLFVEGCGRVDLPGSNPKEMMLSLKRLATLDPKLVVYPGHNYGPSPASTIGEEIKNNPYLSATSESMLI